MRHILISFFQSSRRQHDSNLESLFCGPLATLRQHAGPYALQISYKQMQLSLFYETEVVQLPNEVRSWVRKTFVLRVILTGVMPNVQNDYTLRMVEEQGFEWTAGEENLMCRPPFLKHIQLTWFISKWSITLTTTGLMFQFNGLFNKS
jgi:hypothetical protein